MLSPTRLNDVRILHFEPATLGGQRCACSFGVRYRAIIWPHPCIIACPLTAGGSLVRQRWSRSPSVLMVRAYAVEVHSACPEARTDVGAPREVR